MAKLKTKSRTCPTCGGDGRIHEADGPALRKHREEAGVSLGEMARRMKLSTPYLSDIERGNRKPTQRVVREYQGLGETP